MRPGYIPAKLFFAGGALLLAIGVAISFHDMPWDLLSIPLVFFFIPRLIPFGAAAIAMPFGLIYFEAEKRLVRSPGTVLALAHLIAFFLAILAHVACLRELSRILGADNPAYSNAFSLLPFEYLFFAAVLTIALFILGVTRKSQTS